MGGWQGHLEDHVDGAGDIAVVIFGTYSLLCPNPLLPSITYKATLVCKLHGGTDLVCLLTTISCAQHKVGPRFYFRG